jgi:hypothetical protein
MKKNMKGGGPGQGEEGEVQYLPLGEVVVGSLLGGVGLNLDSKSIENYDKLLHDPVALEKMETGLENLTNIATPILSKTIDQMVEPVSEGIHKVEANVLNGTVSALPLVSEVVNVTKSAASATTAGLDTFTEVTDIAKDNIETFQDEAAKLNTVAIPIGKINNTAIREDDRLENTDSIKRQRGGARILSRIQKSVKNFMGKSKKNTHKNTHKNTNKKRSMKGGTYNKNNKRVLSQKGGKILSRINESLKIFNRM